MSDTPSPPRIFLSYAREDDEPFVHRLHADLTQAGFKVWFDRQTLMSRGLTFHQEIKDAIRTEVDRVVYVGGPKAALSANVREEWQFALECDHVVVVPILRLGGRDNVPGELSLLHTEDFRDDAKYPTALAKLIAHLRLPVPKLGALFAVPSLPPHFLGRPELMDRVRDALLVDLQKPQVITGADARVGMQGMGGIGKSVLAAALARNREIRQAYPDGVIWISCGQNLTRDDLLQRQRDLAKHLGGEKPFDSLPQGQGVLRELLAAKAVLLVLDDAWRASDAQVFDVLGPRCRMLVTTRDAGILHALHGEHVPVSLFTEPEALQLLADAVGVQLVALPTDAKNVITECGCLPLAIALSGGMAKKRGGDFSDVLERLRRADLEKIGDRESINEQHQSIWRAMQASVEVLSEDEQHRFAELAVFDPDDTVPAAAVATFWARTGSLNDLDTQDLLINLAERSLIQLDFKPDAAGKPQYRFRLHDLLRDYAVRIADEPKALHQKLIDAYRMKCTGGWHTGPNDGYFFEKLASHLVATEAWPEIEGLLSNFSWLMRKCEPGLLDSIAADYATAVGATSSEIKLRLDAWRAFFREKAHILRRGRDRWPAHRILLQLAIEYADESPVTKAAETWLSSGRCDWKWLRRTSRPAHVPGNSCLAVLEGHSRSVRGVEVLADGRLLSWSSGSTLRLWDGRNGACLTLLKGHSERVVGALELPDGRLLSWSYDRTLRLWDGSSGTCLSVLIGHSSPVKGALVLADGRLLSWADDDTLRLWDNRSGTCLSVLEGHSGAVRGALVLPNGRLLSWAGYEDKTLRLWDLRNGAFITAIQTPKEPQGVLALTDNRLLYWSGDEKLQLWDCSNSTCLFVLEGHEYGVNGALVVPGDRVLSWSADKTLRLWDNRNGTCLSVLKGHSDMVRGAELLSDGRLLTWAAERDMSLRLWEPHSGRCLAVLKGHSREVLGARALPDGRLLSWSADNTLRLWDHLGEGCIGIFQGHSGRIGDGLALADGRLVSWSWDKTLRIWASTGSVAPEICSDYSDGIKVVLVLLDSNRTLTLSERGIMRLWDSCTGASVAVLQRHTPRTTAVRILPDRRFLSWSSDGPIWIWDAFTGTCRSTLEGHSSWITGALILDDNRLLSWSHDKTLRLWDLNSGDCQAVFHGHSAAIYGALVLPDGRMVSWAEDGTLRLWNNSDGKCLAVLKGHTARIDNVSIMPDGRIMSLSGDDKTLRIWDCSSGACLVVLKGHSHYVAGAKVLPEGRLLTWSWDQTLRIWDSRSGICLFLLKGHTGSIYDAAILSDDRILSLSGDMTLRIWDSRNGACMSVLEGHSDIYQDFRGFGLRPSDLHALMLPHDKLLSWFPGHAWRLWHIKSESCVERVDDKDVPWRYPNWLRARDLTEHPTNVTGMLHLTTASVSALLFQQHSIEPVAAWHADSQPTVHRLLPDGTGIVTQQDGQVCFLQLHHGHRRISLEELEKSIFARGASST